MPEKEQNPIINKQLVMALVIGSVVVTAGLWITGYVELRDLTSVSVIAGFIYFYYFGAKPYLEKRIGYSHIDHEKEIPKLQEKLARMGFLGIIYKTAGSYKRGEMGGEPNLQYYLAKCWATPWERFLIPKPLLVKVHVLTRNIIDIEPDTQHISAPGVDWSGSNDYPFARKEKASIYVPRPVMISAKSEEDEEGEEEVKEKEEKK